MRAESKNNIHAGKKIIHKNTIGEILRIENSHRLKEEFPEMEYQKGTWYYIMKFPDGEEWPCVREQIEIL